MDDDVWSGCDDLVVLPALSVAPLVRAYAVAPDTPEAVGCPAFSFLSERPKPRKRPVELKRCDLEAVAHMPLREAAAELGVGSTSLKEAARRVGMQRWPYRRLWAKSPPRKRGQRKR